MNAPIGLPRFSWRHIFLLVTSLILVVPYATGFIAYFYNQEEFFLRPVVYLSTAVALVGVNAFFGRPCLPRSVCFLIGLLLLRALAAILSGGEGAPAEFSPSIYGSSFVFGLGVLFMLGNLNAIRVGGLVCALATLVVVAGLNIWEWRFPGVYSTVAGRSAGWLENANASAASLVIMMGLVLSLRPPIWLATATMGLAGLGTYFTLSRGGVLLWIATAVTYLAITTRISLVKLGFVLLWCTVVGAVIFKFTDFNPVNKDEELMNRQELFQGGGTLDIASDSRIDLAIEAARGIIDKPLFGHGAGCIYGAPFSPHNQLLGIWLENGILGPALYIAGLLLLIRECLKADRSYIVGCIPLIGFIPFSHNLLDDKNYLFAWVILGGQAFRLMQQAGGQPGRVRQTRSILPQLVHEPAVNA